MTGSRGALKVIEGQGVDDVSNGSREFRVGHFELPYPIGETIAQRGFHHPRACGRTLQHCLDLSSQAVQHLSGISIKVVCLSEFRAKAGYQCPERLF
jgi:hypothetical protein